MHGQKKQEKPPHAEERLLFFSARKPLDISDWDLKRWFKPLRGGTLGLLSRGLVREAGLLCWAFCLRPWICFQPAGTAPEWFGVFCFSFFMEYRGWLRFHLILSSLLEALVEVMLECQKAEACPGQSVNRSDEARFQLIQTAQMR